MLEARWRKEVSPEGFELWDTILRAQAPFAAHSLRGLYTAWGLETPDIGEERLSVAALLAGPLATTEPLHVVRLTRRARIGVIDGITCCLETIVQEESTSVDSFSIEHEDPSLMAELLADQGLTTSTNTSFVQALRESLGLKPLNQMEGQTWAKRSSASSW